MGCGGCQPKKNCPKPQCPKKRKRLPSINPFFHFLKCVWRKFRGCKRSVVVRYAVKKWRRMSTSEKQPFYDAACRAQALHRAAKKNRPQGQQQECPPCPKPKPKKPCPKKRKKPKCPKCPKC